MSRELLPIKTVKVAPYGISAEYTTNAWGRNTSDSYREFITIGQKHRIRQNGSISKIRIYCSSYTGLSAFYLKIWRKDGTTYDLVGTSDNLVTGFTSVGLIFITLATPIVVQEGDYIGYRLETAVGNSAYHLRSVTTDTGTTSYYVTDATPTTTDYAWTTKSSAADTSCPIEIYMLTPSLIGIGDSLMAGHTVHYSFCEATQTTSIASTILAQVGGDYTYQNMGVGSQTTTHISARFLADVVGLKPKGVIIQGGINDITGGTINLATFTANWTTMLDLCVANSIIPIVLLIFPYTDGTTLQMQTRDTWNAALSVLCATYSTAVVIDAGANLGKFRAGGDAGNLWDIITDYSNVDNIHLNATGYGIVASMIKTQIDNLPTLFRKRNSVSTARSAVSTARTAASGRTVIT